MDLPVCFDLLQRWPVSNCVWRHDARQARAQFQMRLFFSLSAICCLLRCPMTAIWCGEAGIPSNVSVGENDCSWTSRDPRTEIWCGLMGKPPTSYCGSCCANAGPVSTATIPKADSATFVVSKFIFFLRNSVARVITSIIVHRTTSVLWHVNHNIVNENHIVKRIMRECIIVPMLRRSAPKKVPQEFPCEPMDCVVCLTASAFIRSTADQRPENP